MNLHVAIKHFVVLNKYNAWCLITTITIDVQQGAKKKKKSFIISIIIFSNNVIICKKIKSIQEQVFEDLVLFIAKNYHLESSIENIWLR
jgi:hypothetical protein